MGKEKDPGIKFIRPLLENPITNMIFPGVNAGMTSIMVQEDLKSQSNDILEQEESRQSEKPAYPLSQEASV